MIAAVPNNMFRKNGIHRELKNGILEKEFQSWNGNHHQIDDILVIGAKIQSKNKEIIKTIIL